MESLVFGLSVSVVGMVIVFIGLAILIFCIMLLRGASKQEKKGPDQPEKKSLENPPEDAALQVVLGTAVAMAMEQSAQEQLIAVLTAAVSAVWEGDGSFVVRRVRRIQTSPAWQKAGREEQIFSRL